MRRSELTKRYRKKPVVIEAVQYDGANAHEISEFVGESYIDDLRTPAIRTLEGDMRVTSGDWVIQGVQGEFYPVKDSIFRETYEKVEDAAG